MVCCEWERVEMMAFAALVWAAKDTAHCCVCDLSAIMYRMVWCGQVRWPDAYLCVCICVHVSGCC